jgi:hypothetical protein
MSSEQNIPPVERYLWFEGKASPKVLELVKAGLPPVMPPLTEVLFVGFAYADLPFNRKFDVVFPKGMPRSGIRCDSQIIAATQQWGKPLVQIPQGWKTISVVQFPQGIPELVRELPTIDTWHQNQQLVCVCDEMTWQHLKNENAA